MPRRVPRFCSTWCLAPAMAFAAAAPPAQAQAQDDDSGHAPKRTRIYAGPQFWAKTPGARDFGLSPFVGLSRARAGEDFAFEAPDDSFGVTAIGGDSFAVGPALNTIRKRKSSDVGGRLPAVGATIEAGGFAQAWLTPTLRLRVEARKGIGGHGGWAGDISADYVARRGDDWLFSIGPRVTLGDGKYSRAYFGVAPADAAPSGLPAFAPSGGVQSVGLTASYLRQLSRQWGVAAFVRYDRLVGDAAASPVTRAYGSRGQPAFGVALSYTFGGQR